MQVPVLHCPSFMAFSESFTKKETRIFHYFSIRFKRKFATFSSRDRVICGLCIPTVIDTEAIFFLRRWLISFDNDGSCLMFNHGLTAYHMPYWPNPCVISLTLHQHTLTNIQSHSLVAPTPLGKHGCSKYISLALSVPWGMSATAVSAVLRTVTLQTGLFARVSSRFRRQHGVNK